MLNRDFFRILIRIVGVYLFITLIFGALPMLFSLDVDMFFGLVPLALSFVILYLFLRFPDRVINFLGLDKGLDNDRIPIPKFNERKIILLAIFIIGGFLIVDNFARFIIELYYEIKEKISNSSGRPNDGRVFWYSFINILLGWGLITFRKNIANYFEKADREIKKMNDE